MAFNPNDPYDGAWMDIATGVNPEWMNPEEANGANDGPGTPSEPIYTRLEGPWGMPYWDAEENPVRLADIPQSADPLPWSPSEGTTGAGNLPNVGAYRGEYRTRGPIQAFGHEPSGGLTGDQAMGRIMRFPANKPERFDPYGVFTTDPRDDLAASLANDNLQYEDNATVTTNLLQWPNVWGRW